VSLTAGRGRDFFFRQGMKESKLLNRQTGELLLLTIFSTMYKGKKTIQNVAIIYISFLKDLNIFINESDDCRFIFLQFFLITKLQEQ